VLTHLASPIPCCFPPQTAGDEIVVATVSDSVGGTTMVDVPEQLRQELTEAGAVDVRLCELPSDAIQVMRGTPENVVLWVMPPAQRLHACIAQHI
jgi:hypothetical protein